MINKSNIAMFFGCMILTIVACKKDDDAEHDEGEPAPDCQAITDACHMLDDGMPGEINTCHSEIAHENEADRCAEEKDRCIALCDAATADGGAD